jgi:hypothetical protein
LRLTVGEVIRWDNFPYRKDGPIKPRWFIYLGRTSILTTPIFAYLCTTTTQNEHFNPGGSRANHAIKKFDVKQFPMFEQDCILDYDEELYEVPEEILEKCKGHIIVKERLDENTLRNIYKQFSRPGVVSPIKMRDIHDSFNRDGILNLKKPK